MNRRHLRIWIIAALALVPILILTGMIVLAHVIDRPAARQWISAEISARLGAEVGFQRIQLNWLPRPRIVIEQLHLKLPAAVDGQLNTLAIVPAWGGFLRGRFQFSGLAFVHPRIHLTFQALEKTHNPPGGRFSLAEWGRRAAAGVGQLTRLAPDTRIAVQDGELIIHLPSQPQFALTRIQARMVTSAQRMTFELTGRSDLVDTLHAQWQLDPKRLDGQGRLDLTHLDAGRLMRLFHINPPSLEAEAFADLRIAFRTEHLANFSADVSGAADPINLRWRNRLLPVRCKALSGSLNLSRDRFEWVLKALELEDPALKLSGGLVLANPPSPGEPAIRLTLGAREIDLTAVRRYALALGSDLPAVQRFAQIVRQGRLEQVTLMGSGDNWTQVLDPQKIQVHGTACDGVVSVPGLTVPIEHLRGEITFEGGLLKGEQLAADLGPSEARQGVFLLTVSGEPRRLELDTDVTLDLLQTLTLMRPLVKNDQAADALDQIQALEGKAHGRLRLGDRLDKLGFQVHLSDLNMILRHRRLPYPLEIVNAKLDYAATRLTVTQVAGRFKNSLFSGLSARLDWSGPLTFRASVSSGGVDLALPDFLNWARSEGQWAEKLQRVEAIAGHVHLTNLRLQGPAAAAEKWQYQTQGRLEKVGLNLSGLPAALNLVAGQFSLTQNAFSFAFKGVSFLDTQLNISGGLDDYRQGIDQLKLSADGSLGDSTQVWINEWFHLPHPITLSKTIDIAKAEVEWHRQGKSLFAADLAVDTEGRVTLSGSFCGRALRIEKFSYEDRYSMFSAGLAVSGGEYDVSFNGYLDGQTIVHLAPDNRIQLASLSGDFHLRLSLEKLLLSRFEGRLEVAQLVIGWPGHPPLICHWLAARGRWGKLELQAADLEWKESRVRLTGYILPLPEVAVVDLRISSPAIDLDRILGRLSGSHPGQGPAERPKPKLRFPVQGTVNLQLEQFTLQGLTWKAVNAEVAVNPQQADIRVTRAEVCGISTPGRFTIDPKGLELSIQPRAHGLEIRQTNDCLWKRAIRMDGTFDLSGNLQGQGPLSGLLGTLEGDLKISARKGRIYRMNTLAKILAFLNLTEIFAGKMPDLEKEGFGYNSLELKIRVDKGKFHFDEGLLDGRSMTLTLQGSIDPVAEKIDLTILVAPFKTIDRIIQKLPVINGILAGSLVSIPLKVEGDLKDPHVVPLAPSAVGEGLLGIMKRTLQAPFKLIQP